MCEKSIVPSRTLHKPGFAAFDHPSFFSSVLFSPLQSSFSPLSVLVSSFLVRDLQQKTLYQNSASAWATSNLRPRRPRPERGQPTRRHTPSRRRRGRPAHCQPTPSRSKSPGKSLRRSKNARDVGFCSLNPNWITIWPVTYVVAITPVVSSRCFSLLLPKEPT